MNHILWSGIAMDNIQEFAVIHELAMNSSAIKKRT